MTHLSGASARIVSTATTGGAANPLLSGAQSAASTVLSFLSIAVPVAAGVVVLCAAVLLVRWRLRRARAMAALAPT